ncbi:hypothetical protein FACS1894202_01880 [Clostridia bacterium]|nr:hypothetical protein FACS1894202_01880 [Clostridia bacterium]
MSKYEPLWQQLQERGEAEFKMTYVEIAAVLGFELDHSFLTYKKETAAFDYAVGKISMKEKTVAFKKNEGAI